MKNALIIFARNPELGQCKTRLAKTIGNKAALDIYTYLLQHTAKVAQGVGVERFVYYSKAIHKNDSWAEKYFNKKLQCGNNLGERMHNAFQELFNANYNHIVIIGSDLLDLDSATITKAFSKLTTHDVVIGPAKDGGYYLLGLKKMHPNLFKNKDWGNNSVKNDTLNDLKKSSVFLLKELNDIDTFEDLKTYNVLKPFYTSND